MKSLLLAATIILPSAWKNSPPLTTTAGRAFAAVNSAKGNGTRITSPRAGTVVLLPRVIDGVLCVVPQIVQRCSGKPMPGASVPRFLNALNREFNHLRRLPGAVLPAGHADAGYTETACQLLLGQAKALSKLAQAWRAHVPMLSQARTCLVGRRLLPSDAGVLI